MRIVRNIFSKAGIYCMIITMIYALILMAQNNSQYAAITLSQYISVVIFSLLLSASKLLFMIKTFPTVAIWGMHYFACTASFFVVFSAFGNIQINNPSQILFLFLGFSMLYLIIEAIKFLTSRWFTRFSEKENQSSATKKDTSYTPLYK